MTDLCDLAFRYGSDKCPAIKHHYTEYYDRMFGHRRDQVRTVVEIGIGSPQAMNFYPGYVRGASLYMWQDYFPNAMIYGADIDASLLFNEGRIRTFQCDQTNRADLARLIEETGDRVDLFIDDGSHIPEDQLHTCLTVVPLLKPGGWYVIEDVGKPDIIYSLSHFKCRQVSFRGKRFADDRLIAVELS